MQALEEQDNAADTVMDYHERTKHRFEAYAKGPETIDWDAQPNPFRHFDGAPHRHLSLHDSNDGPSYASLYSDEPIVALDWDETTISRLLQFSMALAAWKQYGSSRWSLRCNPSSGNLHPTETYLIILGVEGFDNGLHHYRVDQHRLELRCRYPENSIEGPLVLIGFSSVHWREAWKYGERAYRYCQHDIGHALAAMNYAAAQIGYRATAFPELGTANLERLLGLDRSHEFHADEMEYADILISLQPMGMPASCPVEALLQMATEAEWYGHANRLDPQHFYDWPIIEEAAKATRHPQSPRLQIRLESWPPPLPASPGPYAQQSAQRLILQRRSAQAFDASGSISSEDFFRMMDHVLPRPDIPPWSAQAWDSRLHLVLYIHDVEGLAPGLYLMLRNTSALETLKAQMHGDLEWIRVDEAPEHLPFYRLVQARARRTAMRLSCHQAIAGDSAFSLSMLGAFDSVIETAPWSYNELHYEAGMIGQTLYLEAEAIGLRGTGIGCFFDDAVHELLGIKEQALQVIYHFTVGLAVNDPRLATLPPYNNSLEKRS